MPEDSLVEAIEDGKIVKVPEFYAKREGLLILKKAEIPMGQSGRTPSFYDQEEKPEKTKPLTEYFKKKPDWREQQVISELVENFHWKIRAERRRKNFTRKQLARDVGEPDEKLKILETGRLPSFDFVLINKVQKALGINLRKDQKDFTQTTQDVMSKLQEQEEKKHQQTQARKAKSDYAEISDSGIEILEDEI